MTGERAEQTKKSKYVAQSQRRKDRILKYTVFLTIPGDGECRPARHMSIIHKIEGGGREEANPVSTSHTPSTRPTNQRVEINSYLQPIPLGPTINVTCLSSGAG